MDLESIKVENYKGLDGLEVSEIRKINLITGVNGVGKTALLEAMWLFTGRHNPDLIFHAVVQRSVMMLAGNPLKYLVKLKGVPVSIQGSEDGKLGSTEISFKEVPTIQITDNLQQVIREISHRHGPKFNERINGELNFVVDGQKKTEENGSLSLQGSPMGFVLRNFPEITQRERESVFVSAVLSDFNADSIGIGDYSNLIEIDEKKTFLSALNLILPKVKDVEILSTEDGKPYLSALVHEGNETIRLPVSSLGSGMERICRLILSFTSSSDLLLVDEIESGLHHSVLSDVWENINKWAEKWNVQLVATTHSHECIAAAISAFKDNLDNLAIHHLEKDQNGQVVVATFTGDALLGIEHLNLEVR